MLGLSNKAPYLQLNRIKKKSVEHNLQTPFNSKINKMRNDALAIYILFEKVLNFIVLASTNKQG